MAKSILNLLANGEGQLVEFKESLSSSCRTKGLESLCAMLNCDAAEGAVLFGVKPDGSVVGVELGNLDTAQRTLSQAISSGFDPRLIPEIMVEVVNEDRVVAVSACRPRSVPYYEYSGRAWIRQGSENRMLSVTEKDRLRRSRDRASYNGPWKCDTCGAFVGMLSQITVTDEGPKRTYNCACGGEYCPAT
jgi:predicted HTH transcriptional regulator